MSIKLRGAMFSSVWGASGVSNFFNEHYWFHRFLRHFGHRFDGCTPVAKTSTLLARAGNMPLKEDGVTPRELLPKCIIVNHRNELALNAVSLSGPGLEALCRTGKWQTYKESFQVSVMSLAKTPAERKAELEECFKMVKNLAAQSEKPLGIQLNISCPNGGLDPKSLVDETIPILESADRLLILRIPIIVKVGPDCHPEAAAKIAAHPRCDALCALNTLPFGKHPAWATDTKPVDWKKLFGTDDPKESPLAKRFPGFAGGLSGAPLRPLLLEWLRKTRTAGVRKHINAGGGLFSDLDIFAAKLAGANSVSVGSLSFLKPLRVRSFIKHALASF